MGKPQDAILRQRSSDTADLDSQCEDQQSVALQRIENPITASA
jgi:hypothetical protein